MLKTICAWCEVTIETKQKQETKEKENQKESEKLSHGICKTCYEKIMAEMKQK